MLIDTQWRAVLTDIAQRIEAEPIPWHVHRWAGWGYETPAGFVQACTVPECPAEQLGDEVAPAGFPLDVAGVELDIQDDPTGGVRRAIASEIEHVYRLQDLEFQPGDVILDIGAHVGIVSCYLATRWPEARIYAFEPMPANRQRLVHNLVANGCANVRLISAAATADGRDLTLAGDHTTNTGGYSAWSSGPDAESVPSIALAVFLASAEIRHIALLKLDCEGCEYELLASFPWDRVKVDRLIMEVHENATLASAYGSGARLIAAMEDRVPHVQASLIRIPDPMEVIEAASIQNTAHTITADKVTALHQATKEI
jgi:FkbM family methyltransferase